MKMWCSWCFQAAPQELVQRNHIRRSVRVCKGCGNRIVICRYCRNGARAGKRWDDECCAVHDGTIGSFSRLSMKLDDVTEWRKIVKRDGRNMVKLGKVAGGAATVALVGTGAGLFAAPAVGGLIGGMGTSLTGAAATSHGLAVLGGGSLAAGGLGMAGGTTLIALAGGVLGGFGGGVLVNKYAADVKGFDIVRRRAGRGATVIVVNGFLTDKGPQLAEWRPALRRHLGRNPWCVLQWEAKRLRDLGRTIAGGAGGVALSKGLGKAAAQATKQAGKRIAPAMWLHTAYEVGGNPWHVAMAKARKAGEALADLILRTDGRRRYILIGHSLGARVIYWALRALADAGSTKPRVSQVHLLGGAIDRRKDTWMGIEKAVRGTIHNYYSRNDQVLGMMYRIGTMFRSHAIGTGPVLLDSAKIVNVDVTDSVTGHTAYKDAFPDFMQRS